MRVCVLDDWEGVAAKFGDWSTVPGQVEIRNQRLDSEEAIVAELAGFDTVVLMRERTAMTRSLIQRLPELRLIVTTGSRNAAIDLAACKQAGIVVCGTGPGTGPVVELAWALILACLKRLPALDAGMHAGGWPSDVGWDLAGSTLGLLGLGRTGSRMVPVARAFGMNVVAWSPHLTPERAEAAGVRLVGKRELFVESDAVSVHVVLADSTRGLVGAAELEALGPRSWLVNTSRGPIVDEGALAAALHAGVIAGAGLDVYSLEPLPAEHPLRSAPHLVMTPHSGYVTEQNLAVWYAEVVEALVAFAAGSPVRVID